MVKTKFNIFEPWKTLDPWQKEYIKTEGNCFLLCGRQSGKSAAASIKFGKLAATKPNRIIMMIAYTEKQAYNLFFKTLQYLKANYYNMVKWRGPKKPTKHLIHLINGSIISCYAVGLTGVGLRGPTLTNLVIDEAAPMAREVFTAVTPMLSITGGSLDILSTPRGKNGYFYECSDDAALGSDIRDDFTRFYVSAEDCPRHTKKFLDNEKKTMSSLLYAQEYLAEFLDDIQRIFSDETIKKCQVLERRETFKAGRFYMGSDIAGMGADLNAHAVLDKMGKDNIEQVEQYNERGKRTTETTETILRLTREFKPMKGIGIDDGGVGFGVWCELMENNLTKRKTQALNNASREVDHEGKKSKKLLKVEMYLSLLKNMEQGKIKLLKDPDIKEAFQSIQWRINVREGFPTTYQIFGRKSHIVEAIMRALRMIEKDKSLKLWIC